MFRQPSKVPSIECAAVAADASALRAFRARFPSRVLGTPFATFAPGARDSSNAPAARRR